MPNSPSDEALLAVAERFARLSGDCGRVEQPGVDEVEEWQDFSGRETTNDQLRIEDVIAAHKLGLNGSALHVGMGNSGFAQRFSCHFVKITGITIQQGEVRHARELELPGYEVVLANKYSPVLLRVIHGPFDVIVDNNPTSFCCCRRHLLAMMQNYVSLLAPGGVVLTDRKGLRWTTQPNDPAWGVSLAEWTKIGAIFSLVPVTYTESVPGLRKQN